MSNVESDRDARAGVCVRSRIHLADNLDVLRAMPTASVDLIYIDPPFNSNRSYNVLFKDERGEEEVFCGHKGSEGCGVGFRKAG
mgnify:CR=1 FL=1